REHGGIRPVRWATSCRGLLRELGDEHVPPFAVALDALVGQAAVPKPQPRATVDRLEIPLDRRAARLVYLPRALPSPGVDHAASRLELDELSADDVAAHADAIEAARLRLVPGLLAEPADRQVRFDEVPVHLLRGCVDPDLLAQLTHVRPPASAFAASRPRARPGTPGRRRALPAARGSPGAFPRGAPGSAPPP